MTECDFRGQRIRHTAASALLSLGSVTLLEANHHATTTLKQPYGEGHVVGALKLPATSQHQFTSLMSEPP